MPLTMSIFESSGTVGSVSEEMTDVVLCEVVGTQPDFANALCIELGLPDLGELSSVRRSVHETSLGETDVELVFDDNGITHALLIENKIKASFTQNQLQRYQKRGANGVRIGTWNAFTVVLFAPQQFLDSLAAEDAMHVDAWLSYEWVAEWLAQADAQANALKLHIMNAAIKQQRSPYQKVLDATMTDFHQSVHALASAEYAELKIEPVPKAGRDSSIIHIPNALAVSRDSLRMKMKMGCVEMLVGTWDAIGAERALAGLIIDRPTNWNSRRAKRYASIEVQTGAIDVTKDFNMNEPQVRAALDALRELHQFYHDVDIARVIESNRGQRPDQKKAR